MKVRIIYLAILLASMTACKTKKTGVFTVTGVIENAPGKKVTLMETPYANAQPVILDSAILKDKGSFSLRGRANEEGIYRLIIENGPDVILINDNDNIKVHVDINNYRAYTVEGSPASQSLHQLFEDYRQKDSAILANFKTIEDLKTVPGKDSLLEVMKTANDKNVDGLNNLLRDFIKNSNSPAATFYALGMASQTIKQDELKSLVDATAARFPEHAGLARIKTMMAVKKAPPPPSKDNEAPATGYALLNKPAPDLIMNDMSGKPVSISSFKGKYVLVDFWASWCGPCRAENPTVVAAYNQFKNKNFTVLGVSLDADKTAWKKAVQNDNLTWTHMSDLKQWESAAVAAYGFDGIPFNVLIDPEGKIIASALRGEELLVKLREVLK